MCIGKATRLCSFLLSQRKEYIAKIEFGTETDTLDSEGNPIKTKEVTPFNKTKLSQAVNRILQLKEHIPPAFSAKKINGKRAYQLARENKEVILSPTPVEIYSFTVLDYTSQSLTYQTNVSKGTYIRVISKIFASYLDNICTTTYLRRTLVGDISIENAVKSEELSPQNYADYIITPEKLIKNYNKIFLNAEELLFFKNGRFIKTEKEEDETVMICNKKGICVGFAKIEKNEIRPKIVLI